MQQIPPYTERLLDAKGNLNKRWYLWFQSLKTLDDQIAQTPGITVTGDIVLTTRSFGTVYKMDNGAVPALVQLPTVLASHVGSWVSLVRVGRAPITIQAGPADVIERSSVGGTLICQEYPRVAANITLKVVAAGTWSIVSGLGIWMVT